jgi:hypothetical protein
VPRCDTGPRFFRSHPKDCPIQSPLTTYEGMWRIYSNPDPHGVRRLGEVHVYCTTLSGYNGDNGDFIISKR